MARVDKLLAPRDAATDDEDGDLDSQPPSEYDSDGSLDAEKSPVAEQRQPQGLQLNEQPAVADVASAESSAGEESEEDKLSVEKLSLVEERGRGRQKQPKEPYEVPTSGAFYMHDDRFAEDPPPQPRCTCSDGLCLYVSLVVGVMFHAFKLQIGCLSLSRVVMCMTVGITTRMRTMHIFQVMTLAWCN